MLTHPITRKILEFLAALAVMSFFSNVPFAGRIATLLCGAAAAGIWMLRYNPAVMFRLHSNPNFTLAVEWLCKLSNEPLPNGPGLEMAGGPAWERDSPRTPRPAPALRVQTDSDYFAVARSLREEICGYDSQIGRLMEQSRCNARLRERCVNSSLATPLGIFLLAGRSGLGKRSLAMRFGEHMQGAGRTCVLDAAAADSIHILMSSVRRDPNRTVILENADKASDELRNVLHRVSSGLTITDFSDGAQVSFRDAFLFLLIHKDATDLHLAERGGGAGTGETRVADALAGDSRVDRRIAWSAHAVVTFALPDRLELAEIVLLTMQRECARYGTELGRVAPQILAREVEDIEHEGCFELLPGRAARRLKQPIFAAHNGAARTIDLPFAG